MFFILFLHRNLHHHGRFDLGVFEVCFFGVFWTWTVILRFSVFIVCVCHCHRFLGPVSLGSHVWLPLHVRTTVSTLVAVGLTPALAVSSAETGYCHSAIQKSLCLLGASVTLAPVDDPHRPTVLLQEGGEEEAIQGR